MAEYVTLMGAEQVQRAGRSMQSAAEQMANAVTGMYDVLERLERILREDREARITDMQTYKRAEDTGPG